MALFKSGKIEGMIKEYLDQINTCNEHLKKICLLVGGDCADDGVEALAMNLHSAESLADDLRHKIELKLHAGSLLPGFRGDLLNLLEALDKIANNAEHIGYFIWLQRVEIPDEFKPDFTALIDKVVEAGFAATKAVKKLFKDIDQAHELTIEIDQLESAADHIEHELIQKIFAKDDMDLARKLHLRDLAELIGSSADRAENVGDRLDVLTVKRKA